MQNGKSFDKVFELTAAAEGFHYFETFWQPKEIELLRCHFENGFFYDMFSIKACDEQIRMVVHLPRELPRITKIIIVLGANITAELIEKHCRRTPLIKGVLEIPCKVSVSLLGTFVKFLF